MKNKTYRLTIKRPHFPPLPLVLTLAPPSAWGYCFKCNLEKENSELSPIRIISERPIGISWEERKFCGNCALINLEELEESNHEFENKKEVIKEIKEFLLKQKVLNSEENQELLECYG